LKSLAKAVDLDFRKNSLVNTSGAKSRGDISRLPEVLIG